MEKPKVVIDYNSGMVAVDFNDAYLTSCHNTRRRLKKYCRKHLLKVKISLLQAMEAHRVVENTSVI
jgi:hypothetical protein